MNWVPCGGAAWGWRQFKGKGVGVVFEEKTPMRVEGSGLSLEHLASFKWGLSLRDSSTWEGIYGHNW